MIDYLYRNRPLNLAHRGALREAPENTLAAFRRAMELGADGFELDAKLTGDGAVVAMHDATVNRTTDGTGNVAAFSLAEIRALDAGSWFDFEFRGEQVPTLDEVFEEIGRKAIINVELTNYNTGGDGLEQKVVALIHEHKLARRVVLSSFNLLSLRKVKRLDPSLATALLTSSDQPIYRRRAWLAVFAPHEARHPEHSQITERYMQDCRRRRLRVNSWTPAEEDETAELVQRLVGLGVDGIICNRPEIIRSALQGSPQPHHRPQR